VRMAECNSECNVQQKPFRFYYNFLADSRDYFEQKCMSYIVGYRTRRIIMRDSRKILVTWEKSRKTGRTQLYDLFPQ